MKLFAWSMLAFLLLLRPALAADEKMTETPYFPLQVGNTWTYRVGDNKIIYRVSKHEKVGDLLCARVEMLMGDSVKSYEHIAVKDDGVYRCSFEGKETKPPICILKLPPKKDQSWDVATTVGGESLKGSFKSGAEDGVKVPADTYKTITTSSKDLDAAGMKIDCTYWFAEKVGMVKQEITVMNQKVLLELEKFEPAKK
jgi:hypothetical protein